MEAKPKPKRTKLVKFRAAVAWFFVAVALAVAVVSVWRLPLAVGGHDRWWLDLAVGAAIFLATVYAIALVFGSLGLYVAAGLGVTGLLGLLAGYGDNHPAIVSFSQWCLVMGAGVGLVSLAVRLLFGRKEK